MRSIQRLGDSIRDAWTDAEHSDAGFASLASAALADSELLHSTTKAELNEWFLSGAPLPRQEMRPFGQPALTLYRGDGFYIELLVWLDSTTAIHQHSFAGAFAVYEGSSLHARYRFDCTDAASRELVFGALALRDVEVLRPGDVREINPGPSFVHALFHLERPSLTLVVRTDTLPSWQPQYSYRAPGVGHDPFYDPEPTATQLRLITSLGASQDATFWPIVAAAMRTADPWTTLRLLTVASEVAGDDVRFREVAATARNRHGRRADMMLASLEERARERNIVARRAMAHDPDHRFFLALLLNVGDRPSILDAIRARHPGSDPEALVLQWVGEMSEAQSIGLEFDALSLKMLEHALHGLDLTDFERGLASVFGDDNVEEQHAELSFLWAELTGSQLLRPLFCAADVELAECQRR